MYEIGSAKQIQAYSSAYSGCMYYKGATGTGGLRFFLHSHDLPRVLSWDRTTYHNTSKWAEIHREIGQLALFLFYLLPISMLLVYLFTTASHLYHIFLTNLLYFFYYTMKQELQELHSALEEAKADIVGLWALKFLIHKVSIDYICAYLQKMMVLTCFKLLNYPC